VVSQATRDAVCQYAPSLSANIIFIPNAIDYAARNRDLIDPKTVNQLKTMYGLDGKKIYLYAGHCGGSKGVDLLLDAREIWAVDHPEAILVCNFLPSANRDVIVRRIYASPLVAQYVVFLGMTKRELLAKVLMADVVIVPSRSE
jgi:glycosyltransferase involved in cell wall biosynthesis